MTMKKNLDFLLDEINRSDAELVNMLKRLHLANSREHLDEYLQQCDNARLNPRQVISLFLTREISRRDGHRVEMMEKMARFPSPRATLERFDFTVSNLKQAQILEYAECEWIAKSRNILLYGESGTGKSHIAAALGRRAIAKGYSTLFINADDLIAKLQQACDRNELDLKLSLLCRNRLLIIDELGYGTHNCKDAAAIFYKLIAKRYERTSTIITTNRSVRDWPDFFGGDRDCTKAFIDRFLEYCDLLHTVGESYRLRSIRTMSVSMDQEDRDLAKEIRITQA